MITINLNTIRRERNLILEDLVKLTKLSRGTLNNIENSKTSPTLRQLETISIALKIDFYELFSVE